MLFNAVELFVYCSAFKRDYVLFSSSFHRRRRRRRRRRCCCFQFRMCSFAAAMEAARKETEAELAKSKAEHDRRTAELEVSGWARL